MNLQTGEGVFPPECFISECNKRSLIELYIVGFGVLTEWDVTPRTSACYMLHTSFLLGFLFEPEDGGDIFVRNIS
jgi:hypothetical protein